MKVPTRVAHTAPSLLPDGVFLDSTPIKPRIDYIPAPDSFECLSNDAFLRLKQLQRMHLVPFSKATLWRKCRRGEFPPPIKISSHITAWRVGDVRTYLKALKTNSKGGPK